MLVVNIIRDIFPAISYDWFVSTLPENNKKPKVFWSFQGLQKETNPIKRVKQTNLLTGIAVI